jgi:Uncharacterized copper-binding protein
VAAALVAVVATMGFGATTAVAATKPTTTVTVDVGDTAGLSGAMTMTVSPTSAPAGKVKFVVTNSGTILHEFVVLKLKGTKTYDKLVVNPKTNKVSESTTVGEVGNVPKGKSKSKTLTLKKGKYALVCNISKHYGLGMRAGFTVT